MHTFLNIPSEGDHSPITKVPFYLIVDRTQGLFHNIHLAIDITQFEVLSSLVNYVDIIL